MTRPKPVFTIDRMLKSVVSSYDEFVQPPFAVNAVDERLLENAAGRGVHCRLLIDSALTDREQRARLGGLADFGVEVRFLDNLALETCLVRCDFGLDCAARSRSNQAVVDISCLRTQRLCRSDVRLVRELLVPGSAEDRVVGIHPN